MPRSLTKEKFETRARVIHGDKYRYHKVRCRGWKAKVTIECPDHGDFRQTPKNHILEKNGCPTCANLSKTKNATLARLVSLDMLLEKFRRAHGDTYDYKLVPEVYKEGSFCPRGEGIKIPIICKIHDVFHQSPRSHAAGAGCPLCNNPGATQHKVYMELLTLIPLELKYTFKPKFLEGLEYDLFIPELKLAIELDGDHHYKPRRGSRPGEFKKTQQRDRKKERLSKKNHITLHRINLVKHRYNSDSIVDECLDIIEDYIDDLKVFANKPQRKYLDTVLRDVSY